MSIDKDGPNGIPKTSILYQNAGRDITLIDIPTSIAVAQERTDILLSTAPLDAPIAFNETREPKTQKAKANSTQTASGTDKHAEYRLEITRALSEIRSHVSQWCVPRKFPAQESTTRQSGQVPNPRDGTAMDVDDLEKDLWERLQEWATVDESKGPRNDNTFDFERMMASLGATPELNATSGPAVAQKWFMSCTSAHSIWDGKRVAREDEPSREPWTSFFHNPEEHALDLVVSGNPSASGSGQPPQQEYSFRIPPQATFFLHDAMQPTVFRTNFRQVTDEYNLPRHFDLIVLDPPWPNRSAKRKGTYENVGGMPYVKRMLLGMDIDNYVEQNALVGIWITNKDALRQHVLGPGGLFETWNIGLIEEWIWAKTTSAGAPMFDMSSLTRKPYEVFLLGRAAPNAWTRMAPAPVVKKRVIAAVPDVHSRKPCLKELLEPYMPDAYDYSALEIFSRYCVAGWTAWGNEAVKFNRDKYWVSGGEDD